MLREIISRCKNVKYCAGNFTQDFGLDFILLTYLYKTITIFGVVMEMVMVGNGL